MAMNDAQSEAIRQGLLGSTIVSAPSAPRAANSYSPSTSSCSSPKRSPPSCPCGKPPPKRPSRPGGTDNVCEWCGYNHTGGGCRSGSGDGVRPGSVNPGPSNVPDGGGGGGGGDPVAIVEEDDWWNDICACLLIALLFMFLFGTSVCVGSDFYECLSSLWDYGEDCTCAVKDKIGSYINDPPPPPIPQHLEAEYESLRKALNDPKKCPGPTNYAGLLAGASVISTRDTEIYQSLICVCQDKNNTGFCDPAGNDGCSNCACQDIHPQTVLKEGELIPGQCWSFTGVGKILIKLFYKIRVIGVSLAHPQSDDLLPGFFTSAPKKFEVFGYKSEDDPAPHCFGEIQYNGKYSTERFELKHLSNQEYDLVQFNFLQNHGNPNYTAVYRVEVHGLLDRTVTNNTS